MTRDLVWIGYDDREDEAYQVARHSILRHTDPTQIDVRPLVLEPLQAIGLYQRGIEFEPDGKLIDVPSQAIMSTKFANSRFFIPWISEGAELALFVDSDIICCDDVQKLFDLARRRYDIALWCVQRGRYSPFITKKVNYLHSYYPRKNWSSVMLWNLKHPSHLRLTTAGANSLPGRDLHAFFWLEDSEIGSLPGKWNHLVGEDKLDPDVPPSILHYTNGGPWLPGWNGGPLDTIWLREREEMENERAANSAGYDGPAPAEDGSGI